MMSGATPKKIKKGDINLDDSSEKPCADEETQKALQEIDICQSEIDTINDQASEEILKAEQKYNKMRKPLFEKRNEIVGNIPNFWITTFLNHPDLSAIINDSEEDCLHHLTKLEVDEFEDIKSGFRISFYFEENPYFENTVLTKEFNFGLTGDHTSQSTQIKWKEGFDLSQNGIQKPNKNSRKRAIEQKSFFMWFSDNSEPTSDDIAEIVKDDLWHNPLQYFLVPDMTPENILDEEASEGNEDDGEGDEIEENDQKPDEDASTV